MRTTTTIYNCDKCGVEIDKNKGEQISLQQISIIEYFDDIHSCERDLVQETKDFCCDLCLVNWISKLINRNTIAKGEID